LTLVIVNLGRRQITTFHLGSCAAKLFVTGREWSHRALPLTKSRRDSDGSFSDLSSGSTSPVRTSCDRAQDVTRGEALNPACSTVPLPTGGADLIVCSTAIWAELEDVAIRDILKHAPAANIASKLVIDQAMAAQDAAFGDASIVLLRINAHSSPSASRKLSYAEARAANRMPSRTRLLGDTSTLSSPEGFRSGTRSPAYQRSPSNAPQFVALADDQATATKRSEMDCVGGKSFLSSYFFPDQLKLRTEKSTEAAAPDPFWRSTSSTAITN